MKILLIPAFAFVLMGQACVSEQTAKPDPISELNKQVSAICQWGESVGLPDRSLGTEDRLAITNIVNLRWAFDDEKKLQWSNYVEGNITRSIQFECLCGGQERREVLQCEKLEKPAENAVKPPS